MTAAPTRRAIESACRIESPRLLGALLRLVRDPALAEDLVQDALVRALERWPHSGIPENPGAWLMTVAKRRGLDALRRQAFIRSELERESVEASTEADPDEALFHPLGSDDVLRLILIACHPQLDRKARVALTLRWVGGLSTAQIARAFLISEPAMAKRLVRAKRSLQVSDAEFELPRGPALDVRLESALEVIYLIFNEGYSAAAGPEAMGRELIHEGLRLGRILASHLEDSEAWGLLALMELQASRLRARTGPRGEAIPLDQQDRGRWDQLLIRRGLAALEHAGTLSRRRSAPLGPYALQAGLAATHASTPSFAETDWPRMLGIYDLLLHIQPSPVVALNRAVALSYAQGPSAALREVDSLAQEPTLQRYPYLWAVKADLLARLSRPEEACRAFEAAAAMTANNAERTHLLRRRDSLSL